MSNAIVNPCNNQSTKRPTHAAIRSGCHCIIVPAYAVQSIMAALTEDALCGMSEEYFYSTPDFSAINPDKINQQLSVHYFRPGDEMQAKLASILREKESAESSVNYYRKRATDIETQLKELQSKLDELVAPKAGHGNECHL